MSRLYKDALITLDKLRVDVVGLFHVKVKPDGESIAAAAQTLGDSVNSPHGVKSLLDGKLVSALRSVTRRRRWSTSTPTAPTSSRRCRKR